MLNKKSKETIQIFIMPAIIIVLVSGIVFAKNSMAKKVLPAFLGSAVSFTKGNSYNMKIDCPTTGIPVADKSISTYIANAQNNFLTAVQDKTPPDKSSLFDFVAHYERTDYKDLVFITTIINKFTGGNTYDSEYKTIIFNKKTNTVITLGDLLESDASLPALSTVAKNKVIDYYKNRSPVKNENDQIPYNEELVSTGTTPAKENFDHIALNEDGLRIIFPVYQVGSHSDGEVRITVPQKDLQGIIKKEYLSAETPATVQTALPKDRNIEKFRDKKLIAFTFDDGPNNPTTINLVERLKKYDAKVTFFVLGCNVSSNEKALKYAYSNGHQIGSHTHRHLNLKKLNANDVTREVTDADNAIKSVIGKTPTVVRPPYGSTNGDIMQLCQKPTILWSVDTKDWKTRNAEAVEKEILANAKDGSIVLLHDLYPTSVDGAINAIDKLSKEGYSFVTVEEMAKLRGKTLTPGKQYSSFK